MRPRTPAPPALEEIFQHVPLAIVTVDADGVLTTLNPAARTLFGATDRIVGMSLLTLPTMARSGLDRHLAAALRDATPVHLPSVAYTSYSSGRSMIVDVDILPLHPGPEGPRGAILMFNDTTGRAQEIERARLFYQSFLHSHEAMEVTDRSGVLVDVNPAFERIYGYRREEAIGQKPGIVRSGKTPSELYRGMWLALLDPTLGRWSGEIVNADRSGREHPVFLTITALRDATGEITHFLGVATDLSEQKEFERQVARADRLASLGQLSAGVAHELNTPLANIMLMAESLHRKAPNPWVAGRADAITAQVEAAARIVGGLLDFSRHHPPEVGEVDLVAAVTEAVDFARGKQSPDIEIRTEPEPGPLPVRGDRVQLLQVFVNIINNASDAMEGRGTLTIASGGDDRMVWVSFADTGPGIPDDVLPHIFEPFFTTKTDGKGTGLGLAIVHGIVHAHGGSVGVQTELGKGTTFTIRLPRASGEVADA
ncbi:MAG: PAS domain S-box protein [Thermoplasmata archaeon]|nr:PAS domain S-box protein [Thermoplasmata archaeon]